MDFSLKTAQLEENNNKSSKPEDHLAFRFTWTGNKIEPNELHSKKYYVLKLLNIFNVNMNIS